MVSAALPIETPEGITFSYELASLSERGWAYAVDFLIRAVVLVVIGVLFLIFLGPALTAGVGLWFVLAFVVEWGYFVLFEMIWDGQSPGKRLFNLRVMNSAGQPIGFLESALRNLLRGADLLPFSYAVATLCVLATRRFQRLGDLAAGTIVVHEKTAWFGSSNSENRPELAAPELRRVVLSNRERRLLQEFVLRQDRLHPERREELARILAEPYRRRFNLPAEESASQLLTKLHATLLQETRA